MKIKKFNESEEQLNISNERVNEIINELSSMASEIDANLKDFTSLFSELENYRTTSKKSNNQIDDASISIDSIKTKLSESTILVDSVIGLLKDYNENGSKYLYDPSKKTQKSLASVMNLTKNNSNLELKYIV